MQATAPVASQHGHESSCDEELEADIGEEPAITERKRAVDLEQLKRAVAEAKEDAAKAKSALESAQKSSGRGKATLVKKAEAARLAASVRIQVSQASTLFFCAVESIRHCTWSLLRRLMTVH